MNRAIGCLPALAFAVTSPADAASVKQETFGCKSLAVAEQLTALQTADDQADYRHELGRWLRVGECRVWLSGEQVIAKDREDGLTCFSPQGLSGSCYWSANSLAE